MNEVVIKLIGGVDGIERFPELIEHFDRWVTRYEPENAKRGEQWIWTTDDPNKALRFDRTDAFTFVRQSIGKRPWDGKPDRPISAFHITIETLASAQSKTRDVVI